MDFRVIEWFGHFYVIISTGFDPFNDPPDVFYAVPLHKSLIRSVLLAPNLVKIPFCEAVEITDKRVITAIYVLYGR